MAGLRLNPPPGWPPVPPGFTPRPGWRPDPSWPPPPPGWQLWVEDSQPPAAYPVGHGYRGQAGSWPAPGQPGPDERKVPARPAGTSGWAIASLVFGIFGGILFSVLFGVIGLRRIRKTGQRGRGLAIAGLALSAAWTGMVVLGLAYAAGNAGNGSAISAPGGVGPFSLKAGECFDNPTSTTSVASVALIPCTHAHSAQVFATFKLTGPDLSYPGKKNTIKLATQGCASRNGILNQAKITKAMRLHFIYPGASQWVTGERSVICLVVNPKPDLASSLLTRGASG